MIVLFSKSKKKEFFVPQVAKVSKPYTLHFNQFEGRKDRCTRIERKIAAACKQILFERNKRIRIRREVQFYFPPILFPPLSPFYLSFFRTSFVPHIAAQFVSGAIFDTHWPRVAEKNIATVLGQNNVVSERNSGKNWRFSTTTNSKRFESTR